MGVFDKKSVSDDGVRFRICPECGNKVFMESKCSKCGKVSRMLKDEPLVRIVAALGYLIFFLPLVLKPKSDFARFHANQGLVFLLSFILIGVFHFVMLFASFFVFILWAMAPFVTIGILILNIGAALVNIVFTLRGRYERMPFYGHIQLISDRKADRA